MTDSLTEEELHFFTHILEETTAVYPPPPAHILSRENTLCVDIGANVGAFSFTAAQHYKNVVALEPVEKNYQLLEKVRNIEKLENLEVLPLAVGAEDSIDRYIYVEEDFSGDSTIYAASPQTVKKQRINMVSYDSLTSMLREEYEVPYIDYLKIDCEGAEYEFLWGEDLSNVKTIIMEIHGVPKHLEGSGITERGFIEHLFKYFTPGFGCGAHIFVGRNPRFMSVKELQQLKELPGYSRNLTEETIHNWVEYLYGRQKQWVGRLFRQVEPGDADAS
jgi:FkbM family methyltransferase